MSCELLADNNNNNSDNAYGVTIVAEPLQKFWRYRKADETLGIYDGKTFPDGNFGLILSHVG